MSKEYTIEHYEKFNNEKGEILSVHKELNDCVDIELGDTVVIDVGRYEVFGVEHMKAFNGGKGQNVLLLIRLVQNHVRDYNQLDALKYLVETGPTYINEWTEAGMYSILSEVILEGPKRYTNKELDELLEIASNN